MHLNFFHALAAVFVCLPIFALYTLKSGTSLCHIGPNECLCNSSAPVGNKSATEIDSSLKRKHPLPSLPRLDYSGFLCKGTQQRGSDKPAFYRVCLFSNVCWDHGKWTFYSGGRERIRNFDYGGVDLNVSGPFPEAFIYSRYLGALLPIEVHNGTIPAHMSWHDAALSAHYEVFIPENVGHFLLEELLPVYLAQRTLLGTIDPDLQVLYAHDCANVKGCVRLSEDWLRIISSRPWEHLTRASSMCFRGVLLGTASWAGERPFGEPQVGRATLMDDFRDHTLQRFGLDPGYTPQRHRITVIQKKCCRRMIGNFDEMVQALNSTFSDIEVVVLDPNNTSSEQQLIAMLNTTVLVTPEGAISYIALFLARGSSAVFVDNWDDREKRSHHLDGFIFAFVPNLFDLYYPVQKSEITLKGGEDYRDNGEVRIVPERMITLVRDGLQQADEWHRLRRGSVLPRGR